MVRKNNNKNKKENDRPSYPRELSIPRNIRRPRERRLSQEARSTGTDNNNNNAALSFTTQQTTEDNGQQLTNVAGPERPMRPPRRSTNTANNNNDDDSDSSNDRYHASFSNNTFRRRASVDTIGMMSTTTRSVGMVRLEMRSLTLPPEYNDDDGDEDGYLNRLHAVAAASGAPAAGDDNNNNDNDHAEEQEERHRVRSRQQDRQDFRTSFATSLNTHTQFISSTDEDPTFWGVSNRWFSDAGEFVGELTGMATRRASVDNAAALPRTSADGNVEIVSAVDDMSDDDDEEGIHMDNTPLFDEMSTLDDPPTGIFTEMSRTHVIRGAWIISFSFIMIWIAMEVAFHSSSWFQAWSSSNREHDGASMFAPRRSKRYGKIKARLVQISGKDVFLNEESPQHKALLYLADGDSLLLDPHDPSVSTQLLQRYALAVFYFSTGGVSWKSSTYWLTGRHECGWLFVICSDIKKGSAGNNRDDSNNNNNVDDDYSSFLDSELSLGEGKIVTGLSLYGQGLRGTIPKEIETLEFLHVLDLGNNKLEGIIGPEFGRLQNLHKLYLENNRLKGGVEAVAYLSALKRVNLENNQLRGTLPYDLGKEKHLEEVRMGKNQLHGSIPSSLLRSHSLTKLDLHDNEFTGELEIHRALSLKYLYLYNNKLSGTLLPSSLCSVSTTLIDLRLNNNSFVGKIPNLNCTMERLELLSLAQNELTGPIHSTLGKQFPMLRELHLYENRLISTIPNSIFRPENLTALLLGNNALTGSLTADMVNDVRNLAHLYLNNNKMGGKLDNFAEASNLVSLKKLRLEYNNFSGSIPKMNMMETIELLYLYNNSLTGTLDNLGSGVNLRKLKASNNSLEGEIPSKLGDLTRLEVLSLNGNNLVGTIPTELQGLTALKELREYC
mmetsp:Transcript_18192/g.39315  ORF Transcript_18192/g.39315 Transcript_18192/m.39315 type:complete len:893 (-) Transcript_18192:619-3297(-)